MTKQVQAYFGTDPKMHAQRQAYVKAGLDWRKVNGRSPPKPRDRED